MSSGFAPDQSESAPKRDFLNVSFSVIFFLHIVQANIRSDIDGQEYLDTCVPSLITTQAVFAYLNLWPIAHSHEVDGALSETRCSCQRNKTSLITFLLVECAVSAPASRGYSLSGYLFILQLASAPPPPPSLPDLQKMLCAELLSLLHLQIRIKKGELLHFFAFFCSSVAGLIELYDKKKCKNNKSFAQN